MVVGLGSAPDQYTLGVLLSHIGLLFVLPTRYSDYFDDHELVMPDVGRVDAHWPCLLRGARTQEMSWADCGRANRAH